MYFTNIIGIYLMIKTWEMSDNMSLLKSSAHSGTKVSQQSVTTRCMFRCDYDRHRAWTGNIECTFFHAGKVTYGSHGNTMSQDWNFNVGVNIKWKFETKHKMEGNIRLSVGLTLIRYKYILRFIRFTLSKNYLVVQWNCMIGLKIRMTGKVTYR